MRIKYFLLQLLITSSFYFLSYSQNTIPQFPTPVFEYLSGEDGLPENSVTCILQDYFGYLWLGTQNGLVKYDGYSMKVYLPEENDSSTISSREIVTIYEDKNKTMWVGTWNGLNKFNRLNETFTRYKSDTNNISSINADWIKCIYEDRLGRFWVGTNNGLNLFDLEKQVFSRYHFYHPESKYVLSVNALIEEPGSDDLLVGTHLTGLWRFNTNEKILSEYNFYSKDSPRKKIGRIQSFCKSSSGKIWMASEHSLSSLDPRTKKFKCYFELPGMPADWNGGSTCALGTIIEDKTGLIWSGFWPIDKGIFCLNPVTEEFRQYRLFPNMPENSNHNRIYSLYEDRSGIIWIGTWLRGLVKWDKRKYNFKSLNNDPMNTNIKSNTLVYDVVYDPKGFIWFVTSDALNKYDFKTGIYKRYLENEKSITKNGYSHILDKSGNIWIGTVKNGLMRFDPIKESYRYYFNNPEDSINLINGKIITLFQDHLGILWLGTEDNGLYKYDLTENKLTHYKHNPYDRSSLGENRVNIIFEDSFGTLWIGTNLNGLDKFDRITEKFTYTCLKTILDVYEDKNKNFWIADYFTGLNLFDRKKNEIIVSYGKKDGLPHNAVQRIFEDDHNNLWIGTDMGLSKFSIEKKTFRNYTKSDGLPDNRFYWGGCKDGNGNMYFSTAAGLIYFHPDSLKDDPIPPKVVLSRISLFNRPGEKLNLNGFISELKEITFPYDQNDLRFDFVGLHFSEPARNTYKYILENFDEDWTDAGTQRNATYTNLDPGEYIFRVNAANKDGIWNEAGTSITIIITPPWWKTIYAYLLYALIILSLIYFTWKLQLKRIKINHEIEMSRFETQKLHEVDEIKTRFFTNISHEFRTPLTLILGPVKQIIERIRDEKTKDELSMVHKNANKLLALVNQLLDISKLESGNMKLQTVSQNIMPFLKALVLSFTSYAERKRITLKFNSLEHEIIAYIDKEKIEQIITNVLSNAFKFTPDGGRIEVTVQPTPKSPPEEGTIKGAFSPLERGTEGVCQNVEIIISDTGVGIPHEKLTKIFDRFYQVNGTHTTKQEGTGIGLSLTKELVELHRGKIEVDSEEGRGTIVTISIPLGKEHLKPEEIIEPEKEKEYEKDNVITEFDEVTKIKFEQKIDPTLLEKESEPMLLIVEDNSDVRSYIKTNLNKDYRVVEAADGEDGWNKALEQIPDLIISDVMMPKMDGLKLCEKLKTDERTSHIPVILLTAKAANQDQIEGYETGADDYIMKPFDTDTLKARIGNLIKQRERLHQYFQHKGMFELEQTKITSVDKKFLQKAFDIITQNISNTAFNVEMFAENLAVSRALLHKKIVSLTGEPPVELIRRIRLTKAKELIDKKFGNLSEISLEVGFNNPAYFSESFKKQFGITPSQYQQKILKN